MALSIPALFAHDRITGSMSMYRSRFRPKRNAHQALEVVRQAVNRGQNWVVDADITAFFDEIEKKYP